jgi:hypothetical protein
MSYNCHGGKGHVQSMVWALDRIGIEILMKPEAQGGIGYWCPYDMVDAIGGEIRSTPAIINAGYEVDAMNLVYHSHDGEDHDGDGKIIAPRDTLRAARTTISSTTTTTTDSTSIRTRQSS